MSESTTIPKTHCIECGYAMNRTRDAYGERQPVKGDVSICLNCGHAAIFDENLKLREFTAEEAAHLLIDERVVSAIEAVKSRSGNA